MESDALIYQRIQHTMNKYHAFGDQGNNKIRQEVFTDDAVLATSLWRVQGRANIIATLEKRTPVEGRKPPRLVRHHLTTCFIDITGPETATGRSYFAVYTDQGPDHAGVYVDRFRKVGEEWLIEVREVTIDWKAPNSFVRQKVWWEDQPPKA